ncbi:MAG: hypothetical protein JJE45_00490 [Prolixibacteraceae bacterium]|nr:hypothetical protein [Prolixibacteraceae bacterium]
MDYTLPKANLFKPVSQWGGGGNTISSAVGTAARAGLGIATGGSSEIIAQVLNLIPSIFQGITGASQMKKAQRIESQNPRPEAVIAPSVDKLVNYSYGQTLNQDVPGGEMYRNEIKGATAAGMKTASELGSGSEAYGMLGEMVGREQNSFGDLAKMTAQQVQGNKGDYANALGMKANEENRVWDWNKAQPYLQAAQIAAMLRDSGMKNINAGGKNVFGSGAEYASSMNQNQDFNSSLMWGKNNNGNAGGYNSDEAVRIIQGLLSKQP